MMQCAFFTLLKYTNYWKFSRAARHVSVIMCDGLLGITVASNDCISILVTRYVEYVELYRSVYVMQTGLPRSVTLGPTSGLGGQVPT